MIANQDMPASISALAISRTKLAPAVLKRVEDIAIAAGVHLMRHPPHVDCPGKAEHANVDGQSSQRAERTVARAVSLALASCRQTLQFGVAHPAPLMTAKGMPNEPSGRVQ